MANTSMQLASFQEGKFLGSVDHFCETMNWIIDFCNLLHGDAQNGGKGMITLDCSPANGPVIKLTDAAMKKIENGGGGGGGSSTPLYKQGAYAIGSLLSDGCATLTNPYYQVGGHTYVGPSGSFSVSDGGILALKITATGDTPSASVQSYVGIDALQTAQTSTDSYIIPLFSFTLGEDGVPAVAVDFRTMPNAAMVEF